MFQSHCWNMGPSNETSFCTTLKTLLPVLPSLAFDFRIVRCTVQLRFGTSVAFPVSSIDKRRDKLTQTILDQLTHDSAVQEFACCFCLHSKCGACVELSSSVLACCRCRARAIDRLSSLQAHVHSNQYANDRTSNYMNELVHAERGVSTRGELIQDSYFCVVTSQHSE